MELITKAYNLDYSDTRLKEIENLLKTLDETEPPEGTLEMEPSEMLNVIKNIKWI